MTEPIIQSVIIGFGHRMRVGKDTACQAILRERSGQYNIQQCSFAKALKQEVTEAAGASGGMQNLFYTAFFPDWVKFDSDAPMDDLDCPLGKQRLLLQYWGVWRREEDPDYWVKQVAEQIAKDKPDIALISDMRFENEMALVQRYGEAVRIDRPSVRSPNSHISEEALASVPDDKWDAVLTNDCDLETFRKRAVTMFDVLMNTVPRVR